MPYPRCDRHGTMIWRGGCIECNRETGGCVCTGISGTTPPPHYEATKACPVHGRKASSV
jgi:hypothetical protein